MVHIFASDGCAKMPGGKEQTAGKDIVGFAPDNVFIQAVDHKAQPLEQLIAVGSKVSKGTLLGIRKDFSLPVYSPVSGTVADIVRKRSTVIGRPVSFLHIINDKKGTAVYLKPLKPDPTKEDIVSKMREGGIVGLGGAGFPAYLKYATDAKIDTIIVNAAECEPQITTDYVVGLKEDLSDLFSGIKTILDAMEIESCYLVTKKSNKPLLARFSEEISAFGDPRIKVRAVKSVYPAGYERVIVRLALNRTYDRFPTECGVIVNNLQTMIAIGRLFARGETISDRIVTVSGMVGAPANLRVPYGTLVSDLVKAAGGYTVEKPVIVNCGPMCGSDMPNDDTPLMLQNDAVTVMREKNIVPQPCIRCGTCTAVCPVSLQPCEINYASKRSDFERCFDLGALDCIGCGLCSYVCPSHIEVAAGVSQAKLLVGFKVPRAIALKKNN